ncbi:MAG: peptide-methionine (S)-S-oxide reductase MsrA [Pseudomonadota bacterium]
MLFRNPAKEKMPTPESALPGRDKAIVTITHSHFVLDTPIQGPYPEGSDKIVVGMGCFWGAEKAFWSLPGVFTTAVGYSAGYTPNPSYEEVCSGMTGHNEVVLIVFDSEILPLDSLLTVFWESHNPTQGMRQGNDRGTQYRSGIYCYKHHQQQLAQLSKTRYQGAIDKQFGNDTQVITTEIKTASTFYFAEEYHQQYLAKNPDGYCGLGGMGVCFAENALKDPKQS